MAVNPGTTAGLHARGVNFDPSQVITLNVPAGLPRGPWLTSLPTDAGADPGLPLFVTPLPVVAESESSRALELPSRLERLPGKIGRDRHIHIQGKKRPTLRFRGHRPPRGAADRPGPSSAERQENDSGRGRRHVRQGPAARMDSACRWSLRGRGPRPAQSRRPRVRLRPRGRARPARLRANLRPGQAQRRRRRARAGLRPGHPPQWIRRAGEA